MMVTPQGNPFTRTLHPWRRRAAILTSFFLCTSLALGCTSTQGIGAASGAAVGALSGALIGRNATGALVGAAVGGALGWGAAKLIEDAANQERAAAEDARVYGYTPGAGPVVRIRNSNAMPRAVARGERVSLATDYSVNAPSGSKSVTVTEKLRLEKDGKTIIDFPSQDAVRESGGWVVRNSFVVPEDAEAGTYVVVTGVSAPNGGEDQRDAIFVVQ